MKRIAIQAAKAGGEILNQYFGQCMEVRYKGEKNLVTEADQAAEEAIVKVLRGTFPRHDILAEEGSYCQRNSPYRWIVDPLDGTTNFAHSFPWFAVSIALETQGELVLGVIYQPFQDQLFCAERHGGATLNDRRLQVSSVAELQDALLVTGFPYDRHTSGVNNFDHFELFQRRAQACRRTGSASLDLAYTAAGRFDGFWEMKLKPWDVAAGILLVQEAGGQVTDFNGDAIALSQAEILATNGRIHEQMLALLAQGRRP